MHQNAELAPDARRLANYITGLNGFVVRPKTGAGYNHMGAVICDAVLQAGLNYRTVVAPRVDGLRQRWPSARRTTVFAGMAKRFGLQNVLRWRDPEKLQRIGALTEFLIERDVDLEDDLRSWLGVETNSALLRTVRGVGPKTVDYIKGLVGINAVAVDRHIRTFVSSAGLRASSYQDIKLAVCGAADLLGYDYSALDYAIWLHVSSSGESRRAQAA